MESEPTAPDYTVWIEICKTLHGGVDFPEFSAEHVTEL
jgi:hypothetical protein